MATAHSILIHGAGTMVGSTAVQMALMRGQQPASFWQRFTKLCGLR